MPRCRSLLYVPGNRADLIAKIERFEADGYILDLEDGVPTAEKRAGRETVARAGPVQLAAGRALHLRVNAIHSPWHRQDMELAFSLGITRIHLPKVTSADDVRSVDRHAFELATRWGLPLDAIELYPAIESSRGVLEADSICAASARITALLIGGDDLAAEWGVPRTPEGHELDHVRQELVVVANAYGALPIDTSYPFHLDLEGCARDAARARALGFRGKQAIHPAQCPIFNQAFAPGRDEIDRALGVIAAAGEARSYGHGTATAAGREIDAAAERGARRLLELAGELPDAPGE